MAEPLIRRFDSKHKETYGLSSPRLLEILGSRFSNVDAQSRSDYEALNIEHFDFGDKQLCFLSDYTSNERAYRDFFLLGMIKVTMFGKVFFVKDIETDKVLYPMTISYKQYLEQKMPKKSTFKNQKKLIFESENILFIGIYSVD